MNKIFAVIALLVVVSSPNAEKTVYDLVDEVMGIESPHIRKIMAAALAEAMDKADTSSSEIDSVRIQTPCSVFLEGCNLEDSVTIVIDSVTAASGSACGVTMYKDMLIGIHGRILEDRWNQVSFSVRRDGFKLMDVSIGISAPELLGVQIILGTIMDYIGKNKDDFKAYFDEVVRTKSLK